jgi:hypothetical protein
MKRIILMSLSGLVYAHLALASSWETGGFRTANGQLIQRGMTKAEVRRDAGAPMDRDAAARAKGEKSSASATSKRGEVWTYKGSDGYYSIAFHGGRVVKIDVTPFRGY